MTPKKSGVKPIARNKNARRNFELLDFYEAGMVLTGPEVKSLRLGRVSFKDGYVRVKSGEAWLVGVHIAPYEHAGYTGHDPDRDRKLLLHAHQIRLLGAKIEQKGLSVVPVSLYFKNGRVKLEIALAKGKKTFDRRDAIKQRDVDRDTARELNRYR